METNIKVRLISHTPDAEKICGMAARICYKNINSIDELEDNITEKEIITSLESCLKSGHHSVIEHANFTFAIEGVSRALTHQLVRHRIASYSQQSQRYIDMREFNFITPPTIKSDYEMKKRYDEYMKNVPYEEFSAGVPKEDARFVLPNACESKIIVTMNARSLYNFFKLRCCTHAQWEIRILANKMLDLVKDVAPNLFRYAGPSCVCEKICREKEPCPRMQKEGAINLWQSMN
jgi:thymidylate synthase (FAD)